VRQDRPLLQSVQDLASTRWVDRWETQNRLDDKEAGFCFKNYIIHPLLYVSIAYRFGLLIYMHDHS
jgi:hypothetical protein